MLEATMSKRAKRQPLFDDQGRRIGFVERDHEKHHRRRVWPWVFVLTLAGVAFGYWLSTPAGERFAVAAWDVTLRAAQANAR